jgi:hypothetical protein
MPDNYLIILPGIFLAILVGYALIRFWPKTGKMGINTESVNCPECGLKAPMIRKPGNLRQVMWGGWTCAGCGCEFDKYGSIMSCKSND